jgi:hypothetical protein
MQLNQASGGGGGEGIETFEGSKSIGGGRYVLQCGKALYPVAYFLLIENIMITTFV